MKATVDKKALEIAVQVMDKAAKGWPKGKRWVHLTVEPHDNYQTIGTVFMVAGISGDTTFMARADLRAFTHEAGNCAVEETELTRAVRAIRDGASKDVELAYEVTNGQEHRSPDAGLLILSSGTLRVRLPVLAEAEMGPEVMDEPEDWPQMQVPLYVFKEIADTFEAFTSRDPTRTILGQVMLDGNGALEATATDGRRLKHKRYGHVLQASDPARGVLPGGALVTMARACKRAGMESVILCIEPMGEGSGDHEGRPCHVMAKASGLSLAIKAGAAATFPTWESVVPSAEAMLEGPQVELMTEEVERHLRAARKAPNPDGGDTATIRLSLAPGRGCVIESPIGRTTMGGRVSGWEHGLAAMKARLEAEARERESTGDGSPDVDPIPHLGEVGLNLQFAHELFQSFKASGTKAVRVLFCDALTARCPGPVVVVPVGADGSTLTRDLVVQMPVRMR